MKIGACATLALLAVGCQQPETPGGDSRSTTVVPAVFGRLDAAGAAELACRLANERCEQEWRKRPFVPSAFEAKLQDGRWVWGRYTAAGPQGFSAVVTFDRSGRLPTVQLYFSTDAIAIDRGHPFGPNGRPLPEQLPRHAFPPERLHDAPVRK
jgi:hypothetical protein